MSNFVHLADRFAYNHKLNAKRNGLIFEMESDKIKAFKAALVRITANFRFSFIFVKIQNSDKDYSTSETKFKIFNVRESLKT